MFGSLLHPRFKRAPLPPSSRPNNTTMTKSFIVLVPGFGPGLWLLGSGGDGGIAMKIAIDPPTLLNSSEGPPTSRGLLDLATCGDINGTDEGSRSDVETAVAAQIGDVEVVKVNHHGSSFSSNLTYVSTLKPEAAVVSVGKNSFGHPSAIVVARWGTFGTVFQTQEPINNGLVDGDIVVTTDGTTGFTITGEQSGKTVTSPLDES